MKNSKKMEIRESSFNSLFKNILSVNFTENWNCYETNDNSKNPLVIFKTKKWNKLIELCKKFINNSNDIYDLEVGSIKEIVHRYKMEVK